MTAVTTNILHRQRLRYRLQLFDICSKTRCEFALYESRDVETGDGFAFEGTVHEGHSYDLMLLSGEELNIDRATLILNGENSVKLIIGYHDALFKDVLGNECHAYQLILPRDKVKLFELAFGFAVLELHIVFRDGSTLQLETDEIVCVCDKQNQAEAITNMLAELTSDTPSKAINWMLLPQRSHEGGGIPLVNDKSIPDASKALRSFLQLCKECLLVFERNLPYFQTRPINKLKCSSEIVGSSAVRHFGRNEMEWLAKTPETFYETKENSSFVFRGKNFMPSRVRTSKIQRSLDTFEHRTIIAFAGELDKSIRALANKLEHQMGGLYSMRERLENMDAQGGVLPAMLVIDACLRMEETLLQEADSFQRKARSVLRAFKEALPGVVPCKYRLPRRTKVFQEVAPYTELHIQMRKWEAFGSFELLREGLALKTWRMDKLYEYYVLYRLLTALGEVGFEPATNNDNAIRQVKYTAPSRFYKNEKQVANIYELARGVEKLTLFYEPVVHGSDLAENGVDIHRTTKNGGSWDSCWTPDYYLIYRCEGVVKRFILDAKFRRTGTVVRDNGGSDAMSCFENCMFKYRLSTMAADGSAISALWLLCGRASVAECIPFQNSTWFLAQSSFVPDGVVTVAPKADESIKLLNILGLGQPTTEKDIEKSASDAFASYHLEENEKTSQDEKHSAYLEETCERVCEASSEKLHTDFRCEEIDGEGSDSNAGDTLKDDRAPDAMCNPEIGMAKEKAEFVCSKPELKKNLEKKMEDVKNPIRGKRVNAKESKRLADAKGTSGLKAKKGNAVKELKPEVLELVKVIVDGTFDKSALYAAKSAQCEFRISHPLLREQAPVGREAKLYVKADNIIDGKDCYVFANWLPNNLILLKRVAERVKRQKKTK